MLNNDKHVRKMEMMARVAKNLALYRAKLKKVKERRQLQKQADVVASAVRAERLKGVREALIQADLWPADAKATKMPTKKALVLLIAAKAAIAADVQTVFGTKAASVAAPALINYMITRYATSAAAAAAQVAETAAATGDDEGNNEVPPPPAASAAATASNDDDAANDGGDDSQLPPSP